MKEILGDNILRQITYEDLEKFKYLDAILKESTRILPLVPLMPRISTEERIPLLGTPIQISMFIVKNSQITWYLGDPNQFIPEIFLKRSNNEIVKNSYIPFGGGIRICPGKNMAMVELKTLLILLFRKYDVKLVDEVSEKPKTKYLILYNCTDLKVIVRPRGINV